MQDAVTGAPLAHVAVDLPDLSRRTTTDPSGVFRLSGLEPGDHRLVFSRIGYAPAEIVVSVENGVVTHPRLQLTPTPVLIEGVGVELARAAADGAYSVGAAEIRDAGARTVGDLLRGRPAVIVSERGTGGPQTVSMRGVAADGVLVLVDGVPLNDPVTGEADLSRISASSVESITILPGARTARYGPRAQGGVVLVRTQTGGSRPGVRLDGGSLGRWGGAVEVSGMLEGFRVGAGGEASGLGGGFRFAQPAEVGGGEALRQNTDVERLSGWLAANGLVRRGTLRLRAGLERLERGLPGKSFAPSRFARQVATRSQASATWRRAEGNVDTSLLLFGALDEARFEDPDPSLGPPYDTRTRLAVGGLEVDVVREWAGAWRPEVGGGLDAEYQRVSSGALDERAPRSRTDFAASAHGAVTLPLGSAGPRVSLAVRGHHGGLDGGLDGMWRATHEVGVAIRRGPLSVRLTQRSGFSPPSLGDQYFREGVAVAPNPDLRAERVPSEWEGGLSFTFGAPARLSGGLNAFRGDIRGMIVWQPDFRFVWSPRNVDVHRDGAEAWLGVEAPLHAGGLIRLQAEFTLVRVTYDRDDPEPVQVLYRPRHSATVRSDVELGPWSGGVVARYVGARFPVPSPVNELHGFWSLDISARRAWLWAGWRLRTGLHVDRLLDQKDALIFGFPRPGRTLALSMEVQRLR